MNKRNVIITIISVLILTCIFAFARTTTTDLTLVKPTWTENVDILDDINANSDLLEAFANDPLKFDSDLERLEDRAGAMWTGNTETGLTVTYQDADNTIDVVIGANDIVETMLKFVNTPADEEIFTYESTTGDFEWHTLAELSIQPLDAGLTSIAGLTTAANDMIYTTALNTYAIMDTFAELQAVVADKTLMNEEDAITLDSLFTLANRVVAGSLGSEVAVGANSYGVQWYYFGDNANVTGLRSRAVLKTTDAPAMTAQGAVLQASNADGIDASCLNGALIEAIGKSDTTASTIATMRGALVGTEWNAKETITNLKTLHVRTHTRNSATEGYISGTGYLLYLENEAVGGNGQQLDAGIYLKSTNVSTPSGFNYGMDLSGAAGEIATADIKLSGGGTIGDSSGNVNLESGAAYKINGTALAPTDLDGTAWRVYYADTSGDVTELALGASGTYLKSNGAAAAPTFSTPSGAGDVVGPATNIDEGISRWNGADSKALQDSVLTISDTGVIASLSNADITLQPNGTGDTRIYAPSDVVTTVTAAHTMTIAEAGTVLVSCAATPYTITLPTAVGHSGLRYHFIKTDANYFLITLDGDGTETINYENSTSTPNTTYGRLNTYCAEVTIVSDNSNWQVLDEAMGQVPEFSAYLGSNQLDITDTTHVVLNIDTELYDIGSNFNTTTHQFTAPISGKYIFAIGIQFAAASVIADKFYQVSLRHTTPTYLMVVSTHSSLATHFAICGSKAIGITKDDILEITAYLDVGAATVDVTGGNQYETFFQATLISKD